MKSLIFFTGSLGDSLIAIPAMQAVKRHVGAKGPLYLLHDLHENKLLIERELLEPLGLIDSFITYPARIDGFFKKIRVYSQLIRHLRKQNFQRVYYLIPSVRPATAILRDKLFFWLCGIREWIGFFAFRNKALSPKERNGTLKRVPQEAEFHFLRLHRQGIEKTPLTIPYLGIPDDIVRKIDAWLASHRKHPDRSLVAICPGTNRLSNQWPLNRFGTLGKKILALKTFELVIVGGFSEEEKARYLLSRWQEGFSSAGKLSILESAALFARCQGIVGLDTGTTHLAAAVGTPCLGIYGGRYPPGKWEPLGDIHKIIRKAVPCEGCRCHICPLAHHPCMKSISVNEVWESFLKRFVRASKESQRFIAPIDDVR